MMFLDRPGGMSEDFVGGLGSDGLGDIRAYPPGTHAGVVVIGVENQSPSSVRQAIVDLCAVVDLEDLGGCVAVWRAGMLRVRRAQPTEGDRAGDD